MRYKATALIIAVVVALAAMPPTSIPQVKPAPQSACDAEKHRAIMAENETAGIRLELKTCLARQVDELTKAHGATADAERRLSVSENTVSALSVSYQGSQQHVKTLQGSLAEKDAALIEQKKLNATLIVERDTMARKIKSANGRFLCETISLGCVR